MKLDDIREALTKINPGCGNTIRGFWIDSDGDGDPIVNIVFVLDDPAAEEDGWKLDLLDDYCASGREAISEFAPLSDCWFRTQQEFEAELEERVILLANGVQDCGEFTH